MKKNKIKVSVIIVFYNGIRDLFKAIDSIKKSDTKTDYELIVVNNSTKNIKDNLLKRYKKVKYIKAPKNLGYGAGNNLGAIKAQGEYLLILNPDTSIKDNTIDTLANFLDKKKDTGMVAPNLIKKNGELFEKIGARKLTPFRAIFALSVLDKVFPNNPISRQYYASDLDKNRLRELDAVPGSAFMIRKKVFKQVGGFDENIFMYFEEHDIGNRVKKSGYKIYIEPNAQTVHYQNERKGSKKMFELYQKSRFYYFKKYYGLMRALLTEGFLRINKFDLLFFIVLIFAAYIRIYNSIEFNPFSGEIGDNLLDIKNYYLNKEIPLIGPPTSHPWLYFGPLFYWIYGPILILSGFNPATHAYFGSIVSVLVVIFNYKFTSQLVNKKIGFLSTFIIAFSPFYIGWGQTGRFFTLVLLLIYPYLYFVIKHLKKEKHNLFLAGLFMGLMLNFHFTPLLLVPPTLIISYIYKKAGIIKNSLLYFGGIIIANLPLLIYDALHNFDMLVKFILWIPYRVAGFIGLYPKNNPTQDTFLSNLISFYNYSAETLTAVYPDQKILFFIIFSVSVAYVTYSLIKDTKTNKYVQIILLFLLFGYVGIFIHGNPPEHYYLPIAFIPSVITSLFIKSIRSRYLTLLFLTIVILSGLKSVNYHLNKYSTSSYKIKLEITKKIIDDVGSNPYILKRVGENDEFEGDFAQDYQYLLWWFGNEPIQVGEQKLSDQEPVYVYTIHENTTQLEDSFYHQNDISVIRKKL